MASEEITLKEFSDDRKELRLEILDLVRRFEIKYTGAEIVEIKIDRVDIRTHDQPNEILRETVICALDLSIIVQ